MGKLRPREGKGWTQGPPSAGLGWGHSLGGLAQGRSVAPTLQGAAPYLPPVQLLSSN